MNLPCWRKKSVLSCFEVENRFYTNELINILIYRRSRISLVCTNSDKNELPRYIIISSSTNFDCRFTIAYFVAPSLFSHRIRPSFVTNIVRNKFNGFNITNGTNKRIDDDDADDNGNTICLADIILDDSSS